MRRILLYGNSGSGKTTLATRLSAKLGLRHLDLDSLAWQPDPPPRRRPLAESATGIEAFLRQGDRWVIEGCYADLLALVTDRCTEMHFLDPGIDACVANCRARPWEPHKYPSREAQDANLAMLIDWVKAYATRSDEFSLDAHRRLFDGFRGTKSRHRTVADIAGIE